MHRKKFPLVIGMAGAMWLSAPMAEAKDRYFTSNTPATHTNNAITMKNMLETIKNGTNGEHDIQLVPGAVLVGAAHVLGALSSGTVEGGFLVYAYALAEIPVLNFLGSLFTADDRVAGPAMTETILLHCPQCEEEQQKNNIQILVNAPPPPYNFICANDGIQGAEDVRGKRIRTAGSMTQLVDALGGTPVNLPYTDVYEGIQRGALDCTTLGMNELRGTQLWEIAKYATDTPLGTFNGVGFVTLNRDFWTDMTPEQRKVWLDASADALADVEVRNGTEGAEVRKTAVSEYGVQILDADQSLKDAIAKARRDEVSGQIASAKDRGVHDPEAIVRAFQEAVAKWQGIVERIGVEKPWSEAQQAEYAATIKAETYDKMAD